MKKINRCIKDIVLLFIAALSAGSIYAQNANPGKNNPKAEKQLNKYDDIEIEAMVVDETQTKLGHDFFESFYSQWEVPEEYKNFAVTVIEKPSPRLGTMISIQINDQEAYQGFIQPRNDMIEDAAAQAVGTLLSYMENFEQIQKELQGNDLQGTGIH